MVAPSRSPLLGQVSEDILVALDLAGIGVTVTLENPPSPLFVSQEAARIAGRSVEEILVAPSLLAFAAPEELRRLWGLREARLRGEPIPNRIETVIVKRDGTRVHVDCAWHAVEFEGRRATVSFVSEVTARQQAETALRSSEAERRDLELELLQTRRLAAVGTLAAGVVHEINNPLTYVFLHLAALSRDLPDLLLHPERLPDLLARVQEASDGARRVAGVVDDLNAFARAAAEDADRGTGGPRPPADVVEALTSAAQLVAEPVGERARLTTHFASDLPRVDVVQAHLTQAFLNLLVYTAQSLPPRETPELHDIELTATTDEGDGHVTVEIAADGPGFAPELIDRVFLPYAATTGRGGHAGNLGLSIAHAIVTSAGGQLVAVNRPGGGSLFRVVLPVETP